MMTRRQFNRLSKAGQERALKDSEKYPVEETRAKDAWSSGTDWTLIAELREEMRQDDIDSLEYGRAEAYDRIERPY